MPAADTRLPVELWIDIADFLDSIDIIALATTCRRLRHILLPVAYREICLFVAPKRPDPPSTHRFRRPNTRFVVHQMFHDRIRFYTSASMAPLPRVLRIGTRHSNNKSSLKLSSPNLIRELPYLVNLTTLKLQNLWVDKWALAVITELTRLRVLHFSRCSIFGRLDFSALRLVEVEIIRSTTGGDIILNSDHLEDVTCSAGNLQRIMPTAALDRLRTLSVPVDSPPSPHYHVTEFLQRNRCASLTNLLIDGVYSVDPNVPVEFDFSFALTCYRGPAKCLYFIPDGSRLQDVTLFIASSEALKQLRCLAPRIRRLVVDISLPNRDEIKHAISAFEHLREFCWRSDLGFHPDQVIFQ